MLLIIVNLFQLCQPGVFWKELPEVFSKVTWLSGIITGRWVEVVICCIFLFLSDLASENGILKPQGITERQLVCIGFLPYIKHKTRKLYVYFR